MNKSVISFGEIGGNQNSKFGAILNPKASKVEFWFSQRRVVLLKTSFNIADLEQVHEGFSLSQPQPQCFFANY